MRVQQYEVTWGPALKRPPCLSVQLKVPLSLAPAGLFDAYRLVRGVLFPSKKAGAQNHGKLLAAVAAAQNLYR
jgi:hypothetical protein